jgi:histidinol-phosphate aminotransferase
LEKGIIVRNRSNQPLCQNCLRITIGTKIENNSLIKTLNEL